MKNALQTLPADVAARLAKALGAEEQVLLVGQPVARGFNKVTKTLFAAALFVLIAYPLLLNTFVPETGGVWQFIRWGLYAFYVLSIPLCVACMVSPLLLKRWRMKSAYVVTNQRVLCLSRLRLQSYPLEQGMIERVIPHRDGSGDVWLRCSSARGWLRDIPQFRNFSAALEPLGVQAPSAENYAESALSAARQGMVRHLLILAVLAVFAVFLQEYTDAAADLRASGVHTEAKIVGISEEKREGVAAYTTYRPIVLFTTPDGKQHWEKLGCVDGIYLMSDDYNRPASIGKSVDIIYNPANVTELVVAEDTEHLQSSMIRYIRYLLYIAMAFSVLMSVGEMRAWFFARRLKQGGV